MAKKRIYAALIVALMMTGTETVLAEDYTLDEIVVTANRIPTQLKKVNANVSIITGEDIEKKHFATVGDALNIIPGVNIRNKGITGEAYSDNTVYIDGSSNVVLLINGVRMNTQGNSNELFSTASIVDLNNIERIEVLKGAASTLYGADAEGGVINIITKKPIGNQVKTIFSGQFGSYHRKEFSIYNSGSTERGTYWNVGFLRRQSGDFKNGAGVIIPEKVDTKNYTFNVGQHFGDIGGVDFSISRYDSNSEKIKPVKGKDFFTLATKYGMKDHRKYTFSFFYLFNERTRNDFSFLANDNYYKEDYTGSDSSKGIYDISTTVFNDYITHSFDENNTLIIGYEHTKDRMNYMYYSKEDYTGTTFTNNAVYIQEQWDFSPKWNLTAGARHDKHNYAGGKSTKSLSMAYRPGNKTNLYISYNEFFVAPRVVQVKSKKWGNENLRPEYGYTISAGIMHQFDDTLDLSAEIYKRHKKDSIGLIKPEGASESKYINYDDEHASGANIELKKTFSDKFDIDLGYSYVYVRPQEGKNANLNGYVPRSAWHIGMDYNVGKLNINLEGIGNIRRDGRKTDKTVHKGAVTYWVWNSNMNYMVNKDMEVFVQVNNIFNTNYTERAYALDPDEWVSSPGRNFVMGMKFNF